MTFWMGYAAAALAACGVFSLASWQCRQESGIARARTAATERRVHIDPDLGDRQHADVAAAAATALKRIETLLMSQFASIDVGIMPSLVARMRPAVLTDLLEDMLTSAVHGAPASRLLLTALRQGDQIEVAVVDDLAGADAAYRQARIRGLSEQVALRGGALQVMVHPTAGTTTTLRVLAASDTRPAAVTFPQPVPVRPTLAVDDGRS